jgi:PAT family beta-lactamase induction signal transducer AmpG
MATATPQASIASLMFYVSLVAFADGCQDMSLYPYQLDKANAKMFGPIASIFVFGYKTGMFFSKSITLYLAYYFGWNLAYGFMAFSIFLCTIFIFYLDEPQTSKTGEIKRIERMVESYERREKSKFEFMRIIKATIFECLVCPFKIFMKRRDWLQIISIIMLYRAGDRMAQKMAKPFYVDMGFSKLEIANVVQVFGTIAALIGGIIGGYLVKLFGIKKAMFWTGIVHAVGCLSYVVLSRIGYDIRMLYVTVFIENITCGAIAASFISFLYSLCNKNYAATQYALLWAFSELGGSIFRTISGATVDALGWTNFFLFIPLVFLPSIGMLSQMIKHEKK